MTFESAILQDSTITLPKHIAVIMDGNNRYGKKNDLPLGGGHYQGKVALDPIVEHCRRLGIEVLTVFAFSSENWQRSNEEVSLLMKLLKEAIAEQLPRMLKHQIRLRFIGQREKLSQEVQMMMADAEAQTAHFTEMTLVIAISYGGQWDMVQACQKVAQAVEAGEIKASDVTQDTFAQYVSLADVPAVDLLIRTGGEFRISNFLIWQSAYAEYYFSEALWPEFSPSHLEDAILVFNKRDRRFGGSGNY